MPKIVLIFLFIYGQCLLLQCFIFFYYHHVFVVIVAKVSRSRRNVVEEKRLISWKFNVYKHVVHSKIQRNKLISLLTHTCTHTHTQPHVYNQTYKRTQVGGTKPLFPARTLFTRTCHPLPCHPPTRHLPAPAWLSSILRRFLFYLPATIARKQLKFI